jgi:pimeloyl-ACP methyl ester carboxylesterase
MLEMIRAPTLVISGESDLRDIVWTADTLEQGIVGSQRLIVPGARHLLNITHAEQFNRAVIEFLVGRPR